MSNRFKSALFSGFNRRDVVNYITDQARQKEVLSDRTSELEAQLEQLRGALAAAQEENETLRTELAEAELRAERAEETCRGLQKAVRSSLTELNALSGTFVGEEEEEENARAARDPEAEETPAFAEDDTPAEPAPAEESAAPSEPEEPEAPGDDTPAEAPPAKEPAAPSEPDVPKKRTVEIRRHERI